MTILKYKTNRREALKTSAALMGAGLAGTVFGSMFQSCNTTTENTVDWTPSFFTSEEALTVEAFSDHLLPATDTPGALDVQVHIFIDGLIDGCFGEEQKQTFREGLQGLNADCNKLCGKELAECSTEEKNRFFDAQEDIPMSGAKNLWGTDIVKGDQPSFYRQMKGLCLFGYFTSEKVGEEVLSYEPVPGKFEGCVPADKDTKISSI